MPFWSSYASFKDAISVGFRLKRYLCIFSIFIYSRRTQPPFPPNSGFLLLHSHQRRLAGSEGRGRQFVLAITFHLFLAIKMNGLFFSYNFKKSILD
uniref:Uncharacterized protein n=1 Tax=Lepeophtheirus salmonis TaxID=72036 RepID=A0A0K2TCH5_LEPSM